MIKMKDNFEQEILDKLEKGIELSQNELETLVYYYEHDCQRGEDHRWTREMKTIINFNGKFYAIDWYKALTEEQDDEFYYQPYEVEKTERTIVITEWVEKEDSKDNLK